MTTPKEKMSEKAEAPARLAELLKDALWKRWGTKSPALMKGADAELYATVLKVARDLEAATESDSMKELRKQVEAKCEEKGLLLMPMVDLDPLSIQHGEYAAYKDVLALIDKTEKQAK